MFKWERYIALWKICKVPQKTAWKKKYQCKQWDHNLRSICNKHNHNFLLASNVKVKEALPFLQKNKDLLHYFAGLTCNLKAPRNHLNQRCLSELWIKILVRSLVFCSEILHLSLKNLLNCHVNISRRSELLAPQPCEMPPCSYTTLNGHWMYIYNAK